MGSLKRTCTFWREISESSKNPPLAVRGIGLHVLRGQCRWAFAGSRLRSAQADNDANPFWTWPRSRTRPGRVEKWELAGWRRACGRERVRAWSASAVGRTESEDQRGNRANETRGHMFVSCYATAGHEADQKPERTVGDTARMGVRTGGRSGFMGRSRSAAHCHSLQYRLVESAPETQKPHTAPAGDKSPVQSLIGI